MNAKVTFKWQHPAATYIVCRTADIAPLKAIGYFQEAAGAQFMCKIGHPEIDLPSLMAVVDLGAVLYGRIERTSESGPAVLAGSGRELVIVPCNDALQPVAAVLENGVVFGADVARAYWRVLADAKRILKGAATPVHPVVHHGLTRKGRN